MKNLQNNKKWIIALLICFSNICYGHKTTYKNIQEQAALLKKYYSIAIKSTGKKRAKYERLFFDVFPNSFVNFQQIYGSYIYKDKPGILYRELYDKVLTEDNYNHLKLFDDLESIDKETYYDKYIDIYIGGWWSSDEIPDNGGLFGKLSDDTEACTAILLKRTREELLSAFYFMFDQPHPSPIEKSGFYEGDLYKKAKAVSPKLAEIMETAYMLVVHHCKFFADCCCGQEAQNES